MKGTIAVTNHICDWDCCLVFRVGEVNFWKRCSTRSILKNGQFSLDTVSACWCLNGKGAELRLPISTFRTRNVEFNFTVFFCSHNPSRIHVLRLEVIWILEGCIDNQVELEHCYSESDCQVKQPVPQRAVNLIKRIKVSTTIVDNLCLSVEIVKRKNGINILPSTAWSDHCTYKYIYICGMSKMDRY